MYSTEVTPLRVGKKIGEILGERSIGFEGEIRIGPQNISDFANAVVRIVYQPGLWSAIQRTAPEVIIGDGFFQWSGFALLQRILHGVPLVICYERTFHTERNAQWYRRLYRRAVIRWVDAMACNGMMCATYAQQSLGIPAERITLGHMVADTAGLQNAVEALAFTSRQAWRHRWGDPELVFLVVSNLIKRKGIDHLLAAWAQGERTWGTKASLVIVGDGPERQRLENQAAAAGLQSVYFEGAVDYDRIAAYYAATDAFVIPTLEDNWSLVVPEAMACGLPILCSKYNGCWPELVQEANGWVFDPLDVQDTLQVLQSCLNKGGELPEMGRRSKAIIAGHTPRHAARSLYEACRIAKESFTHKIHYKKKLN